MIIEPVNPPLVFEEAIPVSIPLEVAAFLKGEPGPPGVLEYANFAALPGTGEAGELYLTLTPYTSAGVTSSLFRWSGSAYVPVAAVPDSTDALTEGSTNQYFLGSRVLATVLAGLSTATSAVISSADSVLTAFGKLQAQLTALTSTVANKVTVGASADSLEEGANHLFLTALERDKLANIDPLDYSLRTWAYGQVFRLVSATRDANEAITTATIAWPDGVTGLFITDAASTAFPGAIDAWHATYDSTPSKTVTQPAVTRDAGGAVIAQPAITIT